MTGENFWQGGFVRLRAVEPADWKHFFDWNEDSYMERALDEVHPLRSRAALEKWTSDQATAEPKGDECR